MSGSTTSIKTEDTLLIRFQDSSQGGSRHVKIAWFQTGDFKLPAWQLEVVSVETCRISDFRTSSQRREWDAHSAPRRLGAFWHIRRALCHGCQQRTKTSKPWWLWVRGSSQCLCRPYALGWRRVVFDHLQPCSWYSILCLFVLDVGNRLRGILATL